MAGKLIVSRKSEWVNRRRNYKLFIDGKEVGAIKGSSSEEFMVEPGTHLVQCKIDWCCSPDYKVEVQDGKNNYLRVSSGMKFYPPLFILMLIGVFLPFYFKLTKLPRPEWLGTAQIVLLIPGILYLFYYLTFNRKKYLLVQEDTSNPFR